MTKEIPAPPSAWLEVESRYEAARAIPQPKDSITSEQYAAQHKIAVNTAQRRLTNFYKASLARREKWRGGFVYWPAK